MTDLKRGVVYFLSVLVYSAILVLGIKIHIFFELTGERTYNIKPSVEFFLVFSVIFGLLLAIPKFIFRLKKEGFWKIDWVKIISITLPTFILSLLRYLYFCTGIGLFLPFPFLFKNDALALGFFFFAGVVSGYILLNSIKKEEA
ncbi:hypothetical protein Tfer_2333 [Thermincola ferriacetica]|uniref:Uncharacterized protein n=1 Tax=Thermincola ferriacetica TaxID=281456 RepID=A0A0L6W0H8_9FIRM|nr:hypothetical protein [Thermincola ferriacetica]KNZ69087.1 hypothetical protein Tfer_2333 [Thermincola ferriacetica]